MRIAPTTLLLQTGIIAMAISVGATAMYAWQARAGKIKLQTAATGGMSTFIQQLHNSAHIGNLPVQVVEGHI